MQSDETVENAWTRARCECEHNSHAPAHRCGTPLVWAQRGQTVSGGWEALHNGHKNLGGWEAVTQCQILCWACDAKVTAAATQRDDAELSQRSDGMR